MPSVDTDQRAAYNHRVRAKAYGLTSHFTIDELKHLRVTQSHQCPHCERKVKLIVDHVVPFSRGGNNEITNICLICRRCNSSKGDKLLEEWVDRWYLCPTNRHGRYNASVFTSAHY